MSQKSNVINMADLNEDLFKNAAGLYPNWIRSVIHPKPTTLVVNALNDMSKYLALAVGLENFITLHAESYETVNGDTTYLFPETLILELGYKAETRVITFVMAHKSSDLIMH